jgi:acyl carrier protein
VTSPIEDFGAALAGLLRLDGENRFGREVGLFDDWGLDSLQAFEMIVVIESMAGCVVPPAELPELLTVGDAYTYYLGLQDHAGGALG